EAAFAAGRESRKAAAATVRTVRNGDARQVEAAIEAGWQELCRLRGEGSFSEIVQVVRKRCLVDPEVIRTRFAQRLRERGSEFSADSVPDLPAPRVDAVIGGGQAQIREFANPLPQASRSLSTVARRARAGRNARGRRR